MSTTSLEIPEVTVEDLVARYDALLLDAYGVLIDAHAVIPGAPALIEHLNAIRKPYWVVTNDSSRLPATAEARYQSLGLAIERDRIITAGSLVAGYFEAHNLVGTPCAVIGSPDTVEYVRLAGGEILDWDRDDMSRAEALVIGEEGGFDFMPRMNQGLSMVFSQLDAGRNLRLILPNPDLVYPAGPGRFGFAAGSMALWFEQALAQRYPDRADLTFDRLGKPFAAIFEAAVERAQSRRVVMVGDQLHTDVLGARNFGIDVALATFGLAKGVFADLPLSLQPTFLLRSWAR